MTINILSPHIDDAAYCLAVSISHFVKNQVRVNIINCFTVTKWTIRYVPGGIEEISSMRKKEDENFYNNYNAPISIINLDRLDAPLRNGFIFKEKRFGSIEYAEVKSLKNYLEKNIDGFLFCPLAIGNHIDHAICREAVVRLYKNKDVIFFEDLPYARRISEKAIFSHIKKLERRLNTKLVNYLSVADDCLVNKEENLRLYKTQINDEIRSEILAHLQRLSGERLWGDEILIRKLSSFLEPQVE